MLFQLVSPVLRVPRYSLRFPDVFDHVAGTDQLSVTFVLEVPPEYVVFP